MYKFKIRLRIPAAAEAELPKALTAGQMAGPFASGFILTLSMKVLVLMYYVIDVHYGGLHFIFTNCTLLILPSICHIFA